MYSAQDITKEAIEIFDVYIDPANKKVEFRSHYIKIKRAIKALNISHVSKKGKSLLYTKEQRDDILIHLLKEKSFAKSLLQKLASTINTCKHCEFCSICKDTLQSSFPYCSCKEGPPPCPACESPDDNDEDEDLNLSDAEYEELRERSYEEYELLKIQEFKKLRKEREESKKRLQKQCEKVGLSSSDYALIEKSPQKYLTIEDLERLKKKGIVTYDSLTEEEQSYLEGWRAEDEYFEADYNRFAPEPVDHDSKEIEIMISALFDSKFTLKEDKLYEDIKNRYLAVRSISPEHRYDTETQISIENLKNLKNYYETREEHGNPEEISPYENDASKTFFPSSEKGYTASEIVQEFIRIYQLKPIADDEDAFEKKINRVIQDSGLKYVDKKGNERYFSQKQVDYLLYFNTDLKQYFERLSTSTDKKSSVPRHEDVYNDIREKVIRPAEEREKENEWGWLDNPSPVVKIIEYEGENFEEVVSEVDPYLAREMGWHYIEDVDWDIVAEYDKRKMQLEEKYNRIKEFNEFVEEEYQKTRIKVMVTALFNSQYVLNKKLLHYDLGDWFYCKSQMPHRHYNKNRFNFSDLYYYGLLNEYDCLFSSLSKKRLKNIKNYYKPIKDQ